MCRLGYGCFKDEGLSIQGKLLTIRHRAISRRTALMRRPHVVTVDTVATRRQRSKSLLSVRARLMVNRGGFQAIFLEYGQANAVKEWLRQASDLTQNDIEKQLGLNRLGTARLMAVFLYGKPCEI